MNRALLIVLISLAAIACAAGGYALGAASAPTEEDASSARHEAHAEAFDDALADARQAAHERGQAAGEKVGTRAGEAAGTEAGQSEGSSAAGAELAAAEAAERARNCGAPLFVTGYCPTDEEIAQENQAESLCGSGDYQGAAAVGIDCGPGTSPRP